MRFLTRVLLNALGLVAAAWLVPGIILTGAVPTLVAGLILGLVNAVVKPVLVILTLPFTLLTLGLFLFVVNAICLGLTALLVPGFRVSGFIAALLGSLVVTVVSWLLHAAIADGDRRRR